MGSAPKPHLETEPGRKLKCPRTETRDDRDRPAKSRIRSCIPNICGISIGICLLAGGVLNIIQRILLEVRVVEEVEGFTLELQSEPFIEVNVPSDAEVKVIRSWSGKGVESFAGDHSEIQLRRIKDRSVGTPAGFIQDPRENKVAQDARSRGPATVNDKAVTLVELRAAALGSLVKLVIVSRSLIDKL